MSLRKRILVLVLSLTAIGLAGAGVATFAALRSGLLERVDDQLKDSVGPVLSSMRLRESFGAIDTRQAIYVPAGTQAVYRRVSDGRPIAKLPVPFDTRPAPFPQDLDLDPRGSSFVTLNGTDGGPRFRLLAIATESGDGQLLIAIPLDSVDATLARLVVVEVFVFGTVLVALAAFGSLAVARSFRPLRRITATATEVARSGDLSQRVDVDDEGNEVGQLAAAFNTMVGRIEELVAEKDASEDRLRRFVGDASHELRTPLASIRAHSEMVRRGVVSNPDDLARVVQRIENESTRMTGLVDDLLQLARLDQRRPLHYAPVDLTLVAADAVTDARALSPEHRFALDIAGGNPVVVPGDEAQLRQVTTNLVANAIHHTPPGTSVKVRVAVHGDRAVLEVADDGPGMPTDQAGRVFERFYRADVSRSRATGGTGLGLSIVQAIAHAHGGTASAASSPGNGATFRIELPFARPPVPAEPVAGPPVAPAPAPPVATAR
jgi:two-component system, OmpR family, sensor kinase